MEPDSPSGKAIATTWGGGFQEDPIVSPSSCTTTAGEQNPSKILTQFVKTETLLRHLHQFNMMTTRVAVFKMVSFFTWCVQDVSSARTAHLRVHSSAPCSTTTIAPELSGDRLRESVSENKMAASAMEASVKKDAFKEKAKEL